MAPRVPDETRPNNSLFPMFIQMRTGGKTRPWPSCSSLAQLVRPPRPVTANTSVTIRSFVESEKQARRFFVSGLVQGVGYRYFVQDAADRLHLNGYVRNLRDGRVEVYAIGAEEQFVRLLMALKKGPRGAMVNGVVEEPAAVDAHYAEEFSITHDQ